MAIRLSSLIGKAVVDGATKQPAGAVSELLIDAGGRRLLGLLLEDGKKAADMKVVPAKAVLSYSANVLEISSLRDVVAAADDDVLAAAATEKAALRRLTAKLPQGADLGRIDDALLDEGSGELIALFLASGREIALSDAVERKGASLLVPSSIQEVPSPPVVSTDASLKPGAQAERRGPFAER